MKKKKHQKTPTRGGKARGGPIQSLEKKKQKKEKEKTKEKRLQVERMDRKEN